VAAPLTTRLYKEVIITINSMRGSSDTLHSSAGKLCKGLDISRVPNNGSNREGTPCEVACINEQIAVSIFGQCERNLYMIATAVERCNHFSSDVVTDVNSFDITNTSKVQKHIVEI
jgi:hypothetical protein